MFKIPLPISKEIILIVLAALASFILLVVNLGVGLPILLKVYTPISRETAKSTIDTSTVNKAIELLNH